MFLLFTTPEWDCFLEKTISLPHLDFHFFLTCVRCAGCSVEAGSGKSSCVSGTAQPTTTIDKDKGPTLVGVKIAINQITENNRHAVNMGPLGPLRETHCTLTFQKSESVN